MNGMEGYFKTRLSYEPKRDEIWKVITAYLQRFVPPNAKILELGAGYCSFINHVTALEKHALDISDIVKKHANENVTVYIRSCTELDIFKTDYFDVVFSSFLFEHLTRSDLDHVMKELRRILRTGGVLITLLPNFKYIARHYFDDYTHLQVFTHISFADYLLSKQFEIQEVQGRFLPYTFKSFFPKSAALTKIYLELPFRPFAGNMLVVANNPATGDTHQPPVLISKAEVTPSTAPNINPPSTSTPPASPSLEMERQPMDTPASNPPSDLRPQPERREWKPRRYHDHRPPRPASQEHDSRQQSSQPPGSPKYVNYRRHPPRPQRDHPSSKPNHPPSRSSSDQNPPARQSKPNESTGPREPKPTLRPEDLRNRKKRD